MRKLKKFKTARDGKNALRKYCRSMLRRNKRDWLTMASWYYDDKTYQPAELADRIGISIVKWAPKYNAAIVCVYDTTKPITMFCGDGQEYMVIHTWDNNEFWKVQLMINNMFKKLVGHK